MQEAAREAWLASLSDSAFVRMSLSAVNTAGKWEEQGKECWYKGHLYDVIRQREMDGTTWLYCLDDEREERLIEGSIDVTRANLDQPVKQTGHALSISISMRDLLCETPQWNIEPLPDAGPQYSPLGICRPSSRYARIVIPPPKSMPVIFC